MKITRTDKTPHRAGIPADVYSQEELLGMLREGQREMCAQTEGQTGPPIVQIPVEGTSGASEAKWLALGLVFLNDSDPDDPIFRTARLPLGWTIQPTKSRPVSDPYFYHKSDLVDEHGTVRAGISYKSLYYDRKAFADMDWTLVDILPPKVRPGVSS